MGITGRNAVDWASNKPNFLIEVYVSYYRYNKYKIYTFFML